MLAELGGGSHRPTDPDCCLLCLLCAVWFYLIGGVTPQHLTGSGILSPFHFLCYGTVSSRSLDLAGCRLCVSVRNLGARAGFGVLAQSVGQCSVMAAPAIDSRRATKEKALPLGLTSFSLQPSEVSQKSCFHHFCPPWRCFLPHQT